MILFGSFFWRENCLSYPVCGEIHRYVPNLQQYHCIRNYFLLILPYSSAFKLLIDVSLKMTRNPKITKNIETRTKQQLEAYSNRSQYHRLQSFARACDHKCSADKIQTTTQKYPKTARANNNNYKKNTLR